MALSLLWLRVGGWLAVEYIVEDLAGVVALRSSIVHNPCELVASYTAKEEVHGSQKIVSRSDGKTSPTGPDGTGGEKSQLLGSR